MTPPGIDAETVRLVAQCLNHYATPDPILTGDSRKYLLGSFKSTKQHHYHHSFMELGHLLTRSGLPHPEVSLTVYHYFFCQLGDIVS